MRSLHTATREKSVQQQRPSLAKNKKEQRTQPPRHQNTLKTCDADSVGLVHTKQTEPVGQMKSPETDQAQGRFTQSLRVQPHSRRAQTLPHTRIQDRLQKHQGSTFKTGDYTYRKKTQENFSKTQVYNRRVLGTCLQNDHVLHACCTKRGDIEDLVQQLGLSTCCTQQAYTEHLMYTA